MSQPVDESSPLSVRGTLPVVLVALAVRLAYWREHIESAFFAVPLLDARYYDLVARTLAGGGDLTVFGGFRPLLYPAFIALGYRVGGEAWALPLVLFVQHLLGVATAVFVALTAGRAARCARTGLLAGCLYALASPPLFFEGELLIATLLTFLLSASLWALAVAATTGRRTARGWWALSGGLAGLAVQARPNVLVWLCAMGCMAVLAAASRRRALAAGATVWLVAAVLTLLPFGFLNALQTGRYQILTQAGGINLYVGNRRGADGMTPVQDRAVAYAGAYDDSLRVYAEQEYLRVHPGVADHPNPAAVSRYWRHRALNEMAADPRAWLGLMARKAVYLLWNREVANNKTFSFVLRHESHILRWLPVRWWVLLALAPPGAVVLWRRGHRGLLVTILALNAAYAAGIVLFFVNSRFRIPLWPTAAVLGGAALAHGWRAVPGSPRRLRLGVLAAAAAAAAAAFCGELIAPAEDYARDFFFRSKARLAKGDVEGAAGDIAESLRGDAGNPDAWFHLASVRFAAGDLHGAQAALRDYTRQWPEDPQAWSNLGVVSHRLNRNLEAYTAATRALALDPRNTNALLTSALLALRADRPDRARAMLDRVRGAEGRAEYLAARARLARVDGRDEEAERHTERAREADAGLADAISELLGAPLSEAEAAVIAGPERGTSF